MPEDGVGMTLEVRTKIGDRLFSPAQGGEKDNIWTISG